MNRIRSWTGCLIVAAATAVLARVAAAQVPETPRDTTARAAAPASATAGKDAARPPRRPRRSYDRIEGEELAQQGTVYADAHALIRALRPNWLRVRPGSITRPEIVRVYRDGAPVGGVDALRFIQCHTIEYVEHMNGIDATQRYGTDHGSGAILVRTRALLGS